MTDQEIEALKKANEEAVRNKAQALGALAEIRKRAIAEHGTGDAAELRALLKKVIARGEREDTILKEEEEKLRKEFPQLFKSIQTK